MYIQEKFDMEKYELKIEQGVLFSWVLDMVCHLVEVKELEERSKSCG